jgi:hypothetical protein
MLLTPAQELRSAWKNPIALIAPYMQYRACVAMQFRPGVAAQKAVALRFFIFAAN